VVPVEALVAVGQAVLPPAVLLAPRLSHPADLPLPLRRAHLVDPAAVDSVVVSGAEAVGAAAADKC
jgi:hypothetical protein